MDRQHAALAVVALMAAVLAGLAAFFARRRRRGRLALAPPPAPPRGRPTRPPPQPVRVAAAARRPLRLELRRGLIAAEVWGRDGELTLLVPGIAATGRSFAPMAAALAEGWRAVALDLAGRGRSPARPPGGYGWRRHAEDVLEVADRLGAERPTIVGHSMGAYVALEAAALAPERVARVVLIDGGGLPEPLAVARMVAALRRIGLSFPSPEAAVTALRASGAIRPWHEAWAHELRADLVAGRDGFRRRTSGRAVIEDAAHGAMRDPRALWPSLRAPALLVRATLRVDPLSGLVVGRAERDAMVARIPTLRAVDVEATHLGVLTHPQTIAAVRSFLAEAGRTAELAGSRAGG
jgi:pimeloyl-ACP methyl ester carboxylesterase